MRWGRGLLRLAAVAWAAGCLLWAAVVILAVGVSPFALAKPDEERPALCLPDHLAASPVVESLDRDDPCPDGRFEPGTIREDLDPAEVERVTELREAHGRELAGWRAGRAPLYATLEYWRILVPGLIKALATWSAAWWGTVLVVAGVVRWVAAGFRD